MRTALPDSLAAWLTGFSLLSLAVIIAAPPCLAGEPNPYRVVDIAPNDVLNVRSGAASTYPIVGVIPPTGRGILTVGACLRGWCQINYETTIGWVNARFLAPETAGASPIVPSPAGQNGFWMYRVVGVARNDVLKIRQGPSPNYQIVGVIPPNGQEVFVLDNSRQWWHVNYNGTSGWVNSQFLTRDHFCGLPTCGYAD
jgi:N-acetylmuramoyl-L-alanine amidase